MRSFTTLLFILGMFASCFNKIKMTNDPPPPPMKWYSFPVSGFQLKDALDSFIEKDPVLLYDPFRDNYDPFRDNANGYFGLFMSFGNDTICYVLHISGNARAWLERSDSSHLALMDIRNGHLSPDSFTSVISTNNLTASEKKQYHDIFNTKIIDTLRDILLRSDPYFIRPLNTKDTLEAQWIICKKALNTKCDTFWLTSKNGAFWILSDSSISVPYKY